MGDKELANNRQAQGSEGEAKVKGVDEKVRALCQEAEERMVLGVACLVISKLFLCVSCSTLSITLDRLLSGQSLEEAIPSGVASALSLVVVSLSSGIGVYNIWQAGYVDAEAESLEKRG